MKKVKTNQAKMGQEGICTYLQWGHREGFNQLSYIILDNLYVLKFSY